MGCTRPIYALIGCNEDGTHVTDSKLIPLTEIAFNELHESFNGNITDFVNHSKLTNIQSLKTYQCKSHVHHFQGLLLPCGHCVSCRMQYAKNWSIRGMLEMKLHPFNCFITLTMNDDKLRYNSGCVDIRDLQLFFKRLRKRISSKRFKKQFTRNGESLCGFDFRYLACGEYGSLSNRAHYHAILFGFYPPDVELETVNALGDKVYISKLLTECWSDPNTGEPYGNIYIGDCTRESIAYVAGYVTKKQEMRANPDNTLTLPFVTMSRRPGLGYDYFKKYKEDFLHDEFRFDESNKIIVPRYFMEKIKSTDPDIAKSIRENRLKAAEEVFEQYYSTHRLEVRDEIAAIRFSKLQRNL